ncbi:MAG: tripartite tricarboxylate transporter TctB family protein [Betaproteobacteria bacterium]|nr:tripartite tricarboxylate transporter TctB family protein [Betaproteobacteria bacterium]
MKVQLWDNKDFLAGLLMIGIGAIAFFMALDYPFGSALRMGPGYFPRVLAGILIVFGVYVGWRGLRAAEQVEGVWGWKALAFITVSLWVFGWLMDRVGLIPSLVVLFFVSALAGHEFKIKEVIVLATVMILFAWAVFIYGLGLPYRLFWWD